LSGIAISGALEVYFSWSVGGKLRNLLRGLGMRVGNPTFTWDDWFFAIIAAISILGIVGILSQRSWGKFVSLLVLAAEFVWALTMTVIPEGLKEDWFSFTMDRPMAAALSVLMLISILCVASNGDKLRIAAARIKT
jgi:hypothetical protein